MGAGCDEGGMRRSDAGMPADSRRERNSFKVGSNDMIGSEGLLQNLIGFTERVIRPQSADELEAAGKRGEKEREIERKDVNK